MRAGRCCSVPLGRGRGGVVRGVRVRRVRVRRRRGALPVPRAGRLRHGLRQAGRAHPVALPRAGVRSVLPTLYGAFLHTTYITRQIQYTPDTLHTRYITCHIHYALDILRTRYITNQIY